MGTCILMPTNVTLDTQNALAGLRKWNLVRDDSNTDFPHRVYRDDKGNVIKKADDNEARYYLVPDSILSVQDGQKIFS